MRKFLPIFFFLLIFSSNSYAQPANDNCLNAVVIPTVLDYCSAPAEFTNVGATTEAVYGTPTQCTPPWSGDQRDVWFMFTTPAMPNPIDLLITINGNDGTNGTLVMPQIALYRGDCSGFAELICLQAPLNAVTLSLEALGLDALENYWIRINDYSATGTANEGTFQLCIDEYEPPVVIMDGMTTACVGQLLDTGGDMGDYSNSENITFTICPADPHNCLFLDVSTYDIETNFDELTIYDGPDVNSPISAILTGSGQNFQAQAASGCMTINWQSDGSVTAPGWEASWSCSFVECDNAPPPPPDFMACEGTFFDSGGGFLNYQNNENVTYTICPDSAFTCLTMDVVSYNLENGFDNLFIYDGDDITAPLLTVLTGVGSGLSFSTTNCITVQFISDFFGTAPGWEIDWLCSADPCPPDGSGVMPPDETACSGGFFDSGGLLNNYQNNESWDYTICPDDPHGCLVLFIDDYDIGTLDQLTIFEGDGFGGQVLEQLTGVGDDVDVQTDQGCLTIQFTSSVFSSSPGWVGSFTCVPGACTAPVPLSVTPNVPDSVLVNTISTGGILIQNIQLNCAQGGYGTFETIGGSSQIGLTQGIMLASGLVVDAIGPNTAGGTGTDLGSPGDPTLDMLANSTTQDACELSFEVYAPTDMLSFNYVFGSEEYNEFVNSGFNDAFAFFISGPGIVGEVNLAILPGTANTPVTIDNLNCGNNAMFYNCNNVDNFNCGPGVCDEAGITTEYDGFTDVLQAQATVIPCNWYTLRLVIADAGDGIYDSGVFIEAQSLDVGVAQISPSYEFSPDLDAAVEGCAQGFFNIILDQAVSDTTVIYLTSTGTAINGVDFDLLPDSVVFLPGQTVISIPINPIADGIEEGIEEAIIGLSFQSVCGNFEFDSAKVVIQDNIFVEIPEDTVRICLGDSIQVAAFGAITYLWSPDINVSDINIPDPYFSPTQSAWYTVNGSIAQSICEDVDSVYVEVVAPELSVASDTVFVCENDSVQIEAIIAGGGIVSWSPSIGLEDPNSAATNAFPDSSTTYVVTFGIEGCSTTDSVHVSVIPFPAYSVIPDSTICENDSIRLASNPDGLGYQWVPADGLDDPNSANPMASPDTTTTYTVFVTNSFCVDSTQVTIEVVPLPFLDAGPDISLCEGNTAQLNALTETGGNFFWEPSATLSNQFLPNPIASPLETTTYYVTFTDQGCGAVDSLVVQVGMPINGVSVVPDTTICAGASVLIGDVDVSSGVTYTWSPPDGLADPMDPNTTATPAISTTYTLNATNGICTETRTVTVNVIPDLQITAGPSTNICIGQSVQLDATVMPGGGIYTWSPAAGLSATDIANPEATPTVTTQYTVTYSVLNCESEAIIDIIVNEDIDFSLIRDSTICVGETIILGSTTPVDGATYTWTPAIGLNDATAVNPEATPTETTTYMVIGTNGACSDSSTVEVTVIPELTANAGDDETICEGVGVPLVASGTGGTSFSWSPADGLSCTDCADPIANPSQTTTYTVTHSDGQCSAQDQVTVNVNGNFTVQVSNDTTIFQGDAAILTALAVQSGQNDIGPITYAWTATTGLSEPNSPNTMAAPLETIVYTVTASSEAGCSATATVSVNVLPPNFGVPNAFTPNGDGLNDYFTVESEGNVFIDEFRIYDRWGELVFDNGNPLGWDGRYKGEDMPMDVYIYYAIVRLPTGTTTEVKGDVTLLR